MSAKKTLLSIVVPAFNEHDGLPAFIKNLKTELTKLKDFQSEIIIVDDGSTDDTRKIAKGLATKDEAIRIICLSRNFGKEIATTAGIQHANGAAIITIDADGQHPVSLIPVMLEKWQAGFKVVIGLRLASSSESFIKRYGSRLFYWLYKRLTGLYINASSTDFRLIDKRVQADFIGLTERNRLTRGLIDWLGYRPAYVEFNAPPRLHGSATYSFNKLLRLAIDSVVSLSTSPLYIIAYMGVIVLSSASLLGLIMLVNTALGDPLGWHATGSAYLIVLILFLMGILLLSQGVIGLYLSHIHAETQNRPLYIIDHEESIRV